MPVKLIVPSNHALVKKDLVVCTAKLMPNSTELNCRKLYIIRLINRKNPEGEFHHSGAPVYEHQI